MKGLLKQKKPALPVTYGISEANAVIGHPENPVGDNRPEARFGIFREWKIESCKKSPEAKKICAVK